MTMSSFKKLLHLILIATAVSIPCAAKSETSYTQKVQTIVRRCWNPPKETVPYKVTVKFRVWKNGAITDLIVHNPSGFPGADEAALRAVRQAAPFPSRPEDTVDFMELELDLKYAVNTDKLKGENDPKENRRAKQKLRTKQHKH